MADTKLKAPSITMVFKELASTAVERGDRGIVALALKGDAVSHFTVTRESDIPSTISDENRGFIEDAMKGYTYSPKKVEVYVMNSKSEKIADEYTAAMTYFDTQKFDWFAAPSCSTDSETAAIVAWIKKLRGEDKNVMAVLPDTTGDSEGIIDWTTTLYKGNASISPESGTPRIAGLLAGTGFAKSATYAPLEEYTDCTRMTREEMDDAVGAGKLFAFWDGEKVKLNRAVTSLTTIGTDKGDEFKKIKIVEVMNLIKTDIVKTVQDDYIGKYNNSYDNKLVVITAINNYFLGMVDDGILKAGRAEIDIDAQKSYLKGLGTKVIIDDGTSKNLDDCSDDEIARANTGSWLFIAGTVSILDAIEDVKFSINI